MSDTFERRDRSPRPDRFDATTVDRRVGRVHREHVVEVSDAMRASVFDSRPSIVGWSFEFAHFRANRDGATRNEDAAGDFFSVPSTPSTAACRDRDASMRSRHRTRRSREAFSKTT